MVSETDFDKNQKSWIEQIAQAATTPVPGLQRTDQGLQTSEGKQVAAGIAAGGALGGIGKTLGTILLFTIVDSIIKKPMNEFLKENIPQDEPKIQLARDLFLDGFLDETSYLDAVKATGFEEPFKAAFNAETQQILTEKLSLSGTITPVTGETTQETAERAQQGLIQKQKEAESQKIALEQSVQAISPRLQLAGTPAQQTRQNLTDPALQELKRRQGALPLTQEAVIESPALAQAPLAEEDERIRQEEEAEQASKTAAVERRLLTETTAERAERLAPVTLTTSEEERRKRIEELKRRRKRGF